MAITPKSSKLKPPMKFLTYDLEWLPGEMKLRLVGVYDKQRGYRAYESIHNFCDKELTKKHHKWRFYAHNGGLADIIFLMEYFLTRKDYEVEVLMTGSSAVLVTVRSNGLEWTFIDSLFTIRASLAKIGKELGLEKGDVAWDAPLPILKDYNEQDCRILYAALELFEETVRDLGTELRITLASTAYNLIQRRFVRRPIATSKTMNEKLSSAYIGGRVEVFDRSEHSGYYYDINSSYPYAMTQIMPGEFINRVRTTKFLQDFPYLICADFSFDCEIPPVPYLYGGRLLFPNGRRTQWLCGPEWELVQKYGHIYNIFDILIFDKFYGLREFSETVYAKRKESTGYLNMVFKLLLNSGYGKFGEKTVKTKLIVRPSKSEWDRIVKIQKYDKGALGYIQPGMFILEEERNIPHAHTPLAAYVTSTARKVLYEHLIQADKMYYCDTDGFAVNTSDLPTSAELGALKLEKTYDVGRFIAPKLYYLRAGDKDILKAKGFSRREDFSFGDMERILSGEAFFVGRMMRLREMYNKGITGPKEIEQPKMLRSVFEDGAPERNQFAAKAKRYFYKNGSSRAWRTTELHEWLKV